MLIIFYRADFFSSDFPVTVPSNTNTFAYRQQHKLKLPVPVVSHPSPVHWKKGEGEWGVGEWGVPSCRSPPCCPQRDRVVWWSGQEMEAIWIECWQRTKSLGSRLYRERRKKSWLSILFAVTYDRYFVRFSFILSSQFYFIFILGGGGGGGGGRRMVGVGDKDSFRLCIYVWQTPRCCFWLHFGEEIYVSRGNNSSRLRRTQMNIDVFKYLCLRERCRAAKQTTKAESCKWRASVYTVVVKIIYIHRAS